MKSTMTKQMITVLMLMAFSITAMAQSAQSNHFQTIRDDRNGIVIQESFTPLSKSKVQMKRLNKQKADIPIRQRKKISTKDETNLVKLNIELVEHNNITGYPYDVKYFKTSPNEFNFLEIGENEIPAGTYNFFTWFYRIDENGFEQTYLVIKEDVVVDADMTLTFDADEAKNYISMDTYDINGNLLVLPKSHYDEDGEPEWVDADYDLYRAYTSVSYEGYGEFYFSIGNTWDPSHFYISDVGNKISISVASFFPKDGMMYTVNHYAEHVTSDIQMANDPKDFIIHEETFKSTPIHGESETALYPVVSTLDFGTAYRETEMPDGKLTLCIGKTPKPDITSFIYIAAADYAWTVVEDYGDGEVYSWTEEKTMQSLPILNIDGQLRYHNNCEMHYFDGMKDFNYLIDGKMVDMKIAPENTVYAYPLSKRVSTMLGNSCPMVNFQFQPYPYYEGDYAVSQFMVSYKGRYGEIRSSDCINAHLLVKEGDKIYDASLQGYDNMWIDDYNWDSGTFDVTLTNENIDVDGLQGRNVARMYLDKSKADRCPPSLSILDFRDTKGMVTDRFATAADGILNFYACDHNFNVTEDWKYYWTVSKPTVEVSYTPYDTEDWKPLPVEENPSLFFLPTMGYFYSGSLKDVTGAGREGWFDLKIRLEDEAGNWQEQVISPAFRIDDLVDTGISDEELRMKDDNLKATTVYDLQGRMNNIGCCNKGVSIIRKKNGDVCKVVVR